MTSEPAVVLDVACTVKEKNLSKGFGTARGTSDIIGMNGLQRDMDQRFFHDMNVCITDFMNKATELIVEGNVPRKDKGDPVPPWVDRQLTGISEKILAGVREALFLADDVRAVDRNLGSQLRALAFGRLAAERGALAGGLREIPHP